MALDLNNKKLVTLFIAILAIITILNILRPAWIEPDAIGFYARACMDGKDFNTGILTKTVFSLLPCEEWLWKVFQSIIVFAIFSSFYFSLKKIGADTRLSFLMGFSYFLVLFTLALEDDQIVFPIIVIASALLLSNKNWLNRIIYLFLAITLTYFVWEGAYAVMGIIILATIHPSMSVLPTVAGLFLNKIFLSLNDLTTELRSGLGFFTNNIVVWLMFFGDWKKVLEDKAALGSLIGLMALTFFMPKFGTFIVIPLILLLPKVFANNKIIPILCFGGILSFGLISSMQLMNSEPNEQYWVIVDKWVALQREGKLLYNDWWVGRWIQYKGGVPTEVGGNSGVQVLPESERFYWLGSEIAGCLTIDSVDSLFLQECN